MNQITALDSNFNQQTNILLDDGSIVIFNINYVPNQQGWFYSLQYGNFIANNRRLVVNPNILREFRNILPFGLCCLSDDGYEPIFQNDFSSGRIKLYSMNEDDVNAAEVLITSTIPNALGEFIN